MHVRGKWIKVVERRGQSILISSYFYNGIQTKYFNEALGLDCGLDHYLIVDYVNYYLESEVNRFQDCTEKILNETEFQYLKIVLDKLFKKGNELLSYSAKIAKSIIHDPMVVFEKFSDLCLVFGPSMYFPILIESHVEKKVKAIIKQHSRRNNNHYFSLLTASPIPTEGTKELISLYEIGLAYHKNSKTVDKAIEKMIDRHLHAFGWFSFTKFVGDPWDKKLIIQRIETLDAQRVIKDLNYLRSKAGVQRKILKATYKSLTLSKKEIEIIELAQSLAYFRTYRLDVYTKAGYHAKQLFELLAEKIGLTLQEFVFLTYEEILSTLKNKQQFPKDEVQRRLTETWQLLFAKGVMTLSYDQPFLVENYQHQEEMMITGQIASSGIATGEVRIIRGVLEFKKMKDKAILVTSMTTPDFVPLMQRASAIVTDEGGITCHAAIVSRELKKPCIIGTKIATQVLKDDDFIEVDANKGIVSVLQKER